MQRKYDFDYTRVIWRLQKVFRDDTTVLAWLGAPNILLKGHTPTGYIYRGKVATVLDIINKQLSIR